MLEIRGVTKIYETGGRKHRALSGVSVNFRESEFAAILGPSGSGKTTLLNIIGGLDHYDKGDLKINEISTKKFRDKDWDAYRNHRVGFVFQSYNLIPHQTVLNNVRLALTLSGISKREALRRSRKALKEVGLAEHVDKKPAQLSGGQMQRVAIARALVNDPDILLADEPTGALDSETSVQIMELLAKIAREKLVVMVTHNPELAEEYATRTINLKDGKIISDSDPYDGKEKTDLDLTAAEKKSRKTKMSFLTAFSLSLNNLLTKKARTILVALAGSIGIIGIALISAVSTGFQNYIDKIEEDTLTSYPLMLQKESADLTGILLNLTGESGADTSDGKVHENQVLASTLGTVSNNDLPSFAEYLAEHRGEIGDDIRLMEYEYNVDPLIYTVDATGALAKLNPSSLFTSLVGESSLLSNYSSMTSVFQQYELSNLENDTEILAGQYPSEYNELLLILNDEGQISDMLTYSLGLRDTKELNEVLTKILSGERVEINNEPLTLTYDELMAADLRLVPATETYKYNSKYDVYEDMTEDDAYMRQVYDGAEKLKIVGVAKPSSGMMASGSGVAYLPSLVTHIIERAGETEIVKKQLANPEVDIFSGVKFGEETNDFSFGFEDLVSVNEEKLAQAFGVNVNESAIYGKIEQAMAEAGAEIEAALGPMMEATASEMSAAVALEMSAELQELMAGLGQYIQAKILDGSFDPALMEAYMAEYLASASVDFDGFEMPAMNLPIAGAMQAVMAAKMSEVVNYMSQSMMNGFYVDRDALVSAFELNFTEEELSRVVTAMFTKTKTTLSTNLSTLGYQDLKDPEHISFYFWSFDGKTRFVEFLDGYNDLMRENGEDDKVIDYTDTTGVLMSSVKTIVDAVSYVLIAFVSISLIVSSIMIGVITYISVYERTKEIGILRAIGASKRNISTIFNAETFIIGLLAGLFGVGISYVLIVPINAVLHYFIGDSIPLSAALDVRTAGVLVVLSVVLTLIGGLIPAKKASLRDPVEALRSE